MNGCALCGGAVRGAAERCLACVTALEVALGELAAHPSPVGTVAAVTHRGLRRPRNEDAYAVADGVTEGRPWAVQVVCDGVSSSAHAGLAATIAARTACETLARYARGHDAHVRRGPVTAMRAAVSAAHEALCGAGLQPGAGDPPGTTLVAALVRDGRVWVAWAGDSRAYRVSPTGAELLTRDHSWANEVVASGEMTEAEAMQSPNAHAITRCLGPLEAAMSDALAEPDVREVVLDGPGYVVLCTDGLWNYTPDGHELMALAFDREHTRDVVTLARGLVRHALVQGGRDNIAVTVHAHPATA